MAAIVSLLLAGQARADGDPVPSPKAPAAHRGVVYQVGPTAEEEALRRARSLRDAGAVLAVLGGIGLTFAATLFVVAPPQLLDLGPADYLSVIVLGISLAELIVGVPMLIVGARRAGRLKGVVGPFVLSDGRGIGPGLVFAGRF